MQESSQYNKQHASKLVSDKGRKSKMNFGKLFFFVFACVLALSTVSAAPKWKIFKKIEHFGQNIRDGLIKAGPAVQVVGEAATIYKGK
ncbi:cecropin-B isoform X1 [Pieris rapae]|uniref:cecropin-B isoform X1 n=1 Tax=Pieris rapae TaxID=64459 RepID=UPI001E27BA30|nr:cecropin-B isoform X1 [Pieris rapae]